MKRLIYQFILIIVFTFFNVSNGRSQVFVSDTLNINTEDKDKLNNLISNALEVFNRGDYKNYNKYLDTIYSLCEKNELYQLKNRVLIQQAVVLDKTGLYEDAIIKFQQVLDLSENSGLSELEMAVLLMNLCNTYENIVEYDKVAKLAHEVINLQENQQLPLVLKASAFSALGAVSSHHKQYKNALEYHKKTEQIGIKIKNKPQSLNVIGYAKINLAESYLFLKRYNEALSTAKESLQIAEEIKSSEYQALSLHHISNALKKLNQFDESLKVANKSNKIALEQGYRELVMNNYLLSAEINEELQAYEASSTNYKKYLKAKDDFLITLTKAKRLDVEKELAEKEKVIIEQKESIDQLYVYSIPTILILLMILFFYVRKKKLLEKEKQQMLQNRTILENENLSLKSKLKALAISPFANNNSEPRKKHKKSSLSDRDKTTYTTLILEYMENEKPYLNPGLKQSDVAKQLSISVHLLSKILNDCFQRNFNGFINLYRVNEAKKRLKNPEFIHNKIIAIGYEVGFSSKTSFYRVFKNTVGKTPTDYRSLIKNTS
ncbi:helix-turn-helix domain-containing protein [Aquimarina sp. U1-2]|uniref:helix-turn-helix domain-containing protein n=1 Tax=Aquimarina sp. U1-2 TaxID=2823141 RepID=UPI001AECAE33|nr:helix-turn-helix domain-containing protein [Aquimarina sp. U1-2]MBP2832258.1 helix-turn-helix domain-containing protein [Aquimarina sp. U1-2]